MGLVKACDAFDFSRGVRFSTYAVPVILGEMRRLFRDGGTVKVSRSLKELSLRVVRGREQLAVRLGRDPTIEELADTMRLTALCGLGHSTAVPVLSSIQNFYPCYLRHIDKEPCRVCMQEEDAR